MSMYVSCGCINFEFECTYMYVSFEGRHIAFVSFECIYDNVCMTLLEAYEFSLIMYICMLHMRVGMYDSFECTYVYVFMTLLSAHMSMYVSFKGIYVPFECIHVFLRADMSKCVSFKCMYLSSVYMSPYTSFKCIHVSFECIYVSFGMHI